MDPGPHKNTASRRLLAGALATAALALGACGGGDDGSDESSSATASVSEVSACFDDLGQHHSSEAVIPIEDRLVQSGNVIAVVDSNSSPEYRDTVAQCVPPSG